ncbi:MAG TPA: hypothetical protein VJR23_02085 [Candidatus Acidoferrales bacterium]|nr:hypothetical protein [Candidatus Acidoferrales bacterium]
MKGAAGVAFVLGSFVGAGGMMMPKIARHVHALVGGEAHEDVKATAGLGQMAHTEKQFEFVANAPMEKVAPLFGAWKEREWSPGWKPEFIWPSDPVDREGMIFRVAHGHTHAVWVNTAFDLVDGRIQYAYVVPDAMVTLITLRLTAEGARTRVEVKYERTALDAGLNVHVEEMAEADGNAGPEWEQQVNNWLGRFSR